MSINQLMVKRLSLCSLCPARGATKKIATHHAKSTVQDKLRAQSSSFDWRRRDRYRIPAQSEAVMGSTYPRRSNPGAHEGGSLQ